MNLFFISCQSVSHKARIYNLPVANLIVANLYKSQCILTLNNF